MANFDWDISDASDEPIPEEYGGELEIENIKVVRIPSWQINTTDGKVILVPEKDGTFEVIKVPKKEACESSPSGKAESIKSRVRRDTNQAILLCVSIILGIGFLAVVLGEVFRDKLDLKTYMFVVITLLTALGLRLLKGKDFN
jgi:hypothetical protein